MGARATAADLLEFWPALTLRERATFRVRILDDQMTLQVSDVALSEGQVMIRGDELTGPLVFSEDDRTALGGRPVTTRARLLAPERQVEILDLDEPNVAPPVDDPDAETAPVVQMTTGSVLDDQPVEAEPAEPVEDTSGSGTAATVSAVTWSSNPNSMEATIEYRTPDLQAWSVPVAEWSSSSALKLPPEVLDRLKEAAKRRMVGRAMFTAILVERGLNELDAGGQI